MAPGSAEGLIQREIPLPDGGSYTLVLPAAGDDPVVAHYRQGRQVNEHLLACLATVLPSPGVVVDLGCHVGTFAVAAAALGHRVVAVDALARQVELVARSAEASGVQERLRVIQRGVSDRSGTAPFCDEGLFGAIVTDPERGKEVVSVRTDPVPALLAEAGLTVAGVDLIKMDIEGSELRAVAGMAHELSGGDGPMLLYESNPLTAELAGYSVEGLRTLLEALGYTSYRVEGDGYHPCAAREPQPEGWVDLLALTGRHRAARRLPLGEAWDRPRLLAQFDFWSKLPFAHCRAYVARTLLSHWDTLGDDGTAREILARLAGDEEAGVRAAVDAFRWEEPEERRERDEPEGQPGWEEAPEPPWVKQAREAAQATATAARDAAREAAQSAANAARRWLRR
jgi:FkbM family methyltransferase